MQPMEEFTAAYVERIRQDTFVGVETFFRDADLTPEILAQYKPGIVIQESGWIDVTELEGAPVAGTRYQIYTCQSDAFKQSFPAYRAWTMPRGCYFKVLDVYGEHHHMAVTLLHLPTYSVPYFAQNQHPGEAAVVEAARTRFSQALQEGAAKPVTEEYWRRRTAFPIGIAENGTFFFQYPPGETASEEEAEKAAPQRKGFWQKWFGK
jgi:hypothetical protein